MQDDSANVNNGPNPVPWSGMEIVLSVFLAWLFWPAALYVFVQVLGVEHWYYGGTAPEMPIRLELWVRSLALPFQVLTYPLVFAAYSGTHARQLGLTARRLGRNILAGLSGLLLVPDVLALFWLVRHCQGVNGEDGVERHALEILGGHNLYLTEWILLFFTATVAAPLHEELTFRGVLQPWLAKNRGYGLLTMFAALALGLWYRHTQLIDAWPMGFSPVLEAAAPALFASALLPLYLLAVFFGTSQAAALIAASTLFACIHSTWPTPIPLFLLGLGLGTLAQRTQSLVAPVVFHSLFNSVACVQLLLESKSV
jgi:membrane protease YdiL (CAAX protease family)